MEASVCFPPSATSLLPPLYRHFYIYSHVRSVPSAQGASSERLPFASTELLWRCPSQIPAGQTELCTVTDRGRRRDFRLVWAASPLPWSEACLALWRLPACPRRCDWGQKLTLCSAHLLNINDVHQPDDFVPLGVGAFEAEVTEETDETQLTLQVTSGQPRAQLWS